MRKNRCECCFTEQDLTILTDNWIDFIYRCLSIQISRYSNEISMFICNSCLIKIKHIDDFRYEALVTQSKLKTIQVLIVPMVETKSENFIPESIKRDISSDDDFIENENFGGEEIKDNLFSDNDDSMDYYSDEVYNLENVKEELTSDNVGSTDTNNLIVTNDFGNVITNENSNDCNNVLVTKTRSVKSKVDTKKKNLSKIIRDENGKIKPKIYGLTAAQLEKYNECLQYISDKSIRNCKICGVKVVSYPRLVSHMAIHFPNFTCDICGRFFLLRHYLTSHMRFHKEKILCYLCEKNISHKQYKPHIISHSAENTQNSCHAEKFFGMTDDQLEKYNECLQYISDKSIRNCKICGVKVVSYPCLVSHMLIHFPNFTCDICGKRFILKSYLVQHMKSHEDKKACETKCSYSTLNRKKIFDTYIPFEVNKNDRTCKECGENFQSYNLLVSHLAIHYPRHVCDICSKPFLIKEDLKGHMRMHEKKVPCTICKKIYRARYLARHMSTVHCGEKMIFKCRECEVIFDSDILLRKHKNLIHNIDITKKCKHCLEVFLDLKSLYKHIRAVHKIVSTRKRKMIEKKSPFDRKVVSNEYVPFDVNINDRTCKECGENFQSYNLLASHLAIHYPRHICDICGKPFLTKANLTAHMRMHEEKIACTICKKIYRARYLTKHMNIVHCGEKITFKCRECKEIFDSDILLRKHKNLIHNIDITKKCKHCSEVFLNIKSLYKHIREVHKIVSTQKHKIIKKKSYDRKVVSNEYVPFEVNINDRTCKECGENFQSYNLLASHLAIHYPRHVCDICAKPFLTKVNLTAHMRMHKEKVPCTICKKIYRAQYLARHMSTVHCAEKIIFKCRECEEIFDSDILLRKHKNLIHNIDITKKCKHCSEVFLDLKSLYKHIRAVHKIVSTRKRKMIEKKSPFDRKVVSNEYVPFEVNINDRTCKECGENFQSYNLLASHLAIHYPRHICDICGKPFLTKANLTAHMRMHEEKIACTICKKIYRARYLTKHMNIVHCGEKITFKCRECEEKFTTSLQRMKHMEEVHNVVFMNKCCCEMCSKIFYNKSSLQFHIRIVHLNEQKYFCQICNMGFFNKFHRDVHLSTHANKDFHCEICHKSFHKETSLKYHMKFTHGKNKMLLKPKRVKKNNKEIM